MKSEMRYWPQADRRLQCRGRKPAALRLVKTIREWTGAGCVVRKAKNLNWDGLDVEQFCNIITLRYYVTCPGVLQENDYCNYNWNFAYVSTVNWHETAARAMPVPYIHMLEIVLTCWRPKRIVARTSVHVCTIICPDGLCGKSSAVGLHIFSLL